MNDELAAYCDELNRLTEAQKDAAQTYAAHMIYMKHQMYGRNDELRAQLAAEAESEWLRIGQEIRDLNAAKVSR